MFTKRSMEDEMNIATEKSLRNQIYELYLLYRMPQAPNFSAKIPLHIDFTILNTCKERRRSWHRDPLSLSVSLSLSLSLSLSSPPLPQGLAHAGIGPVT